MDSTIQKDLIGIAKLPSVQQEAAIAALKGRADVDNAEDAEIDAVVSQWRSSFNATEFPSETMKRVLDGGSSAVPPAPVAPTPPSEASPPVTQTRGNIASKPQLSSAQLGELRNAVLASDSAVQIAALKLKYPLQAAAIDQVVRSYNHVKSQKPDASEAWNTAILTYGEPAPSKAKTQAVTTYGAVLDATRGYYGALDYITGMAPPNTLGLVMGVGPAVSLPPGVFNLFTYSGEQLSFDDYALANVAHRIGQFGYSLGNVAYTTQSRPTADYDQFDGAPYGDDHNTSEQKIDLYLGQAEPMLGAANQLSNGMATLHNYRADDDGNLSVGSAVVLDTFSLLTSTLQLTWGVNHDSLDATLQGNVESGHTQSLITSSVQDETGEEIGSSHAIYDLFGGGAVDQVEAHNLMLAQTAYKTDMVAQLGKHGTNGIIAGTVINSVMTGVQAWAPWEKDKDAMVANGHITSRGLNTVSGVVGTVGATVGALASNGESTYLESMAMTTMRAQTALTNYYPSMMGPMVNQAILGQHGTAYGTDAPVLGSAIAGLYQVGGGVGQAITAGIRDASNPNDVRNKADYIANAAVDVAMITGAVATAYNPNNHFESGTKAAVIGTAVGAVAARQATYFIAKAVAGNRAEEYLAQTGGHLVGGKLNGGGSWGADFTGTGLSFGITFG